MSFLKGFVQAIQEDDARDFQREQVEEARAYDRERTADERKYREKTTASDRAHSRSEWLFRATESRKFELAAALAKRQGGGRKSSSGKGGNTTQADLEWAIGTFGEVEGSDDFLAQMVQNPELASQLKSQIKDAEKTFAKDGYTYQFNPKTIVENAQIYGVQGAVDVPSFSEEDIEAAANDPDLFAQMMSELGPSTDQIATVDIGTPVPPKNADGQVEAVNGLVDFVARQAMVEAQEAGDSQRFQKISSLLNQLGKEEGMKETRELYSMFGSEVVEMLGEDRFGAWMEGADRNPMLASFFSIANQETQTEEETEEETPAPLPDTTTGNKPTFSSEEELRQNIDSIADGTIVVINGREFIVNKSGSKNRSGSKSRRDNR